MTRAELTLVSHGFGHVPLELHDDEFEFVVSGKQYKCNLIIAEFLSPKICSLRRVDPTVREYILETEDPLGRFIDFLSLAFQPRLEVDPEDFDFFLSISRDLENQELISQLCSAYFAARELTATNAVQRLQMRQMCKAADEEEISFIAQNFHDIPDISDLEIHHLRRVLSHPSLRIPSEDDLYNFICKLIEKDPSFSELFEFVLFKFLSVSSIRHFVDTSASYIFDYLNVSIWKSLCDRLSEKTLVDSSSSDLQKSRYGSIVVQDEVQALRDKIRTLKQELDPRKRLMHHKRVPPVRRAFYQGDEEKPVEEDG